MRRLICQFLSILWVASCLSGCGVVVRQYVYPPDLELNQDLQGYLYESVNAEGYTGVVTEDSVDFRYDPSTEVRYLLNPGFSIAIITDGSELTEDQLEAHFASTRARAEEILAIARARLVPTATDRMRKPKTEPLPAQETQPAPAVVEQEPAIPGSCEQLIGCYGALSALFCESGEDAEPCPFASTVEMRAGDERVCQKMLRDVPFVLGPHTEKNPEAQIPARCTSRGP